MVSAPFFVEGEKENVYTAKKMSSHTHSWVRCGANAIYVSGNAGRNVFPRFPWLVKTGDSRTAHGTGEALDEFSGMLF